MLKKFGDASLFELVLKKFNTIKDMDNPFSDICVGIYKGDRNLWNMANDYGVKILERNKKSITQGTEKQSDIQHYLRDTLEKYVLNLNACVPFIKPETIIEVGNIFKSNQEYKSLVCGMLEYNFFWDKDINRPINNPDVTNTATQRVKPLIGENGSMVIYDKEFMFKYDRYWNFEKNDPYVHILEKSIEFLDIDIPLDFTICENIYENKYNC